jgi:BirA family transcriptional regulator, biotin operon repressor / biotin---[acetyl-CoA-carboxylase] ligase
VSAGPSAAARPRPFDPERFAELRSQRGLVWGSPLHYASETGSSNDLALTAARSGAASGSVFLADYQSQGRGRRGKAWLSAPNHNLLFSVLLRPGGAALPPAALTLAVGLGVRAALAPLARESLAVKWPNDVLAGPCKLAGILCEGQLDGAALAAVVIGIGINVHAAEYPAELSTAITSLEALAGGERLPEREALLADVLAGVEARVSACLRAGFAPLLAEYGQHDALAGQRVEVSGSTPLIGTARGVDAEGRLLVESDGLRVPVSSGTVRTLHG